MKKIKVVASGSGTLLYYHIGVLKRLVETFDIEEIIGTSGGAFILAFLATGYSIPDIEGIAKFEKLSNCVDSSWNFFDKFGIVEGNKILKVLEKYLTKTLVKQKYLLQQSLQILMKKSLFIFLLKILLMKKLV